MNRLDDAITLKSKTNNFVKTNNLTTEEYNSIIEALLEININHITSYNQLIERRNITICTQWHWRMDGISRRIL